MAKTKNITRKNRKQRGGMEHDIRTTKEDETKNINTFKGEDIHELSQQASKDYDDDKNYFNTNKVAVQKEDAEKEPAKKEGVLSGLTNYFSNWGREATGGNKKQLNPAFGGYLKGGKKHVRNTKKNTKKRTGGNKCNCGCKNCRCSSKNCKCKCADKRFNCTCNSRTCGCKRTLKRRKH
jgi:hypothetical protein